MACPTSKWCSWETVGRVRSCRKRARALAARLIARSMQ